MSWDDAFAYVVGEEGVLSMDPRDRGNWTSGIVGQGALKGTKYGISAMSFPNEDIANLTLERAKQLAKPGWWDVLRGDEWPDQLAVGLFDSSYNQGPGVAIKLMQKALGLNPDGVVGGVTLATARTADVAHVAKAFTVARIVRYSQATQWLDDCHGWTDRAITTYTRMLS